MAKAKWLCLYVVCNAVPCFCAVTKAWRDCKVRSLMYLCRFHAFAFRVAAGLDVAAGGDVVLCEFIRFCNTHGYKHTLQHVS